MLNKLEDVMLMQCLTLSFFFKLCHWIRNGTNRIRWFKDEQGEEGQKEMLMVLAPTITRWLSRWTMLHSLYRRFTSIIRFLFSIPRRIREEANLAKTNTDVALNLRSKKSNSINNIDFNPPLPFKDGKQVTPFYLFAARRMLTYGCLNDFANLVSVFRCAAPSITVLQDHDMNMFKAIRVVRVLKETMMSKRDEGEAVQIYQAIRTSCEKASLPLAPAGPIDELLVRPHEIITAQGVLAALEERYPENPFLWALEQVFSPLILSSCCKKPEGPEGKLPLLALILFWVKGGVLKTEDVRCTLRDLAAMKRVFAQETNHDGFDNRSKISWEEKEDYMDESYDPKHKGVKEREKKKTIITKAATATSSADSSYSSSSSSSTSTPTSTPIPAPVAPPPPPLPLLPSHSRPSSTARFPTPEKVCLWILTNPRLKQNKTIKRVAQFALLWVAVSVAVERGFSKLGRLKDKLRSRMSELIANEHMLIMENINYKFLPEWLLDRLVDDFLTSKPRRFQYDSLLPDADVEDEEEGNDRREDVGLPSECFFFSFLVLLRFFTLSNDLEFPHQFIFFICLFFIQGMIWVCLKMN
jgi:hypothetical protein